MSQRLIDLNDDLRRLRDEGYKVEIVAGHVVIRDVPYVDEQRQVRFDGVLASELDLSGERTMEPKSHVALFGGVHPCDNQGRPLTKVVNSAQRKAIDGSLTVDFLLSTKHPNRAYRNYYEKMTRYVDAFSGYAAELDRSATAKTFPPVRTDDDDSPFCYVDTASSRAGIAALSNRLRLPKVAIIGLGGTGSYVLDLVSKTPVREIHVFDGDRFSNHNAFRSPGAASLDELEARPTKVAHFGAHYSKMHRGIIRHDYFLTADNVADLLDMSFVFICVDKGSVKEPIVRELTARGVPFVDVGMGVLVDASDQLGGQLRVTTSTPKMREHVVEKHRISFGDNDGGAEEYKSNIQIAELNALNASLAVIRWKKLCGFYRDLEAEHFSVYQIDGNTLINDDKACNAD